LVLENIKLHASIVIFFDYKIIFQNLRNILQITVQKFLTKVLEYEDKINKKEKLLKVVTRINHTLAKPITLIETARKLMVKILTNNLSKILMENRVLEKSNYASLLNNSTFEPFKIIQGIIDANKYKKEVWIFIMNISKA
jgi:hypothetical protein